MIRDNNSIVIPEKPQALSGIHRANASRGIAALLLPLALLFAPQAAQAQCTPVPSGTPGAPAPAGGTVECQPGDYADGINYSSLGDLTLEVPDDTVDLNVFDDGISVTGAGGDNLFFDASEFTQNINATGGAVIDYVTDTGNISIETGTAATGGRRVSGRDNATHGIRATSNGDGNIDITTYRAFALTDGGTSVEAVTDGGNIEIMGLAGGAIGSASDSEIRHGIFAQTSGAGSILMNLSDEVAGGRTGTGIRAMGDTGDITINADDGVNMRGNGGTGIHVTTDGAILVNAGGDVGGTSDVAIGILTESAGEPTIINVSGASGIFGTDAAIRSSGSQVVVNLNPLGAAIDDIDDYAGIRGPVDFSALTGSAEINVGNFGAWEVRDSVFSDGQDVVSVAAGGVVHSEFDTFLGSAPGDPHLTIVDFGDGADTFTNGGELVVAPDEPAGGGAGKPRDGYASELRFENLDTFTNAGVIRLGAQYHSTSGLLGSDRWYDDILAMPGTNFVGTGASRIVVDTLLNNIGQTACDGSLRNADGDMPAADCVDLRGGTASGSTQIRFNDQIPGDRGAYNPEGNVIVDVSGGSADPDAFTMAPDSDSYNADLDAIDKGFFIYPLAYDPETQQFKLYGVPGAPAQQLPLLAHGAQELWRASTANWFGRGLDMRDALREGADVNGGTWIRVNAESSDRDVIQPVPVGGDTVVFDNSHQQDSRALNLGIDFLAGRSGDRAWVVGATIGYATADIEYDRSPNDVNMEGMSAGLYGSFLAGDFFVDAIVNGNWLKLDNDIPSLDLFPEGTILNSDVQSLGAQVEAGWRMQMGRFGVEPLASLSYVRTDFDDIEIPADNPNRFGAEVQYADPVSFRGGLGVRLSMDNVLPGFVPTDLSLTARAVEEFDGEADVSIANLGPTALVNNTFDGTFAQVTVGVNVHNASKTAAGYLNVDGMFESDYERVGIEVGFRYQW